MTNQPKLSEVLGLEKKFFLKHKSLLIRENNRVLGYNQCLNDLDQISPNVEALAKEMFEVCCYPDPTKWEEITQNEKDVWVYRAGIIVDNMQKWIKKG